MAMKNLLTPAGIEPATFRFVAQHLNHCATAVPFMKNYDDGSQVEPKHVAVHTLMTRQAMYV